ncbi:MAG: hypothetical protein IPO86_01960 [Saprospiraceae bacterium]|nr:hypothetical protein [Saprospiraceae bacterium]
MIYKILLAIAFVLCLLVKKNSKFQLPWFRLFLFILVLVELIVGPYVGKNFGNNTWVYNILIILEVQYFSLMFYFHFRERNYSKKLLLGSFVISAASILNFLYGQGYNTINTISYNFGMCFVLILIVLFFYDLIKFNEDYLLMSIPLFWLSVGILLFYSATFPVLVFLNTIINSELPLVAPLYSLLKIGNIFLSLSYIAVLLCPWIYKKQSIELS